MCRIRALLLLLALVSEVPGPPHDHAGLRHIAPHRQTVHPRHPHRLLRWEPEVPGGVRGQRLWGGGAAHRQSGPEIGIESSVACGTFLDVISTRFEVVIM